MNIQPMIWGFRANNPLDYIERELWTRDGMTVKISNHGNFVVYIDGKMHLQTDDNSRVCYFLNLYDVGVRAQS